MDTIHTAQQSESGNFVIMDNGNRFYLHVIGISPMSQPNKPELDATNTTATIQ
jgi:hypothetical protein